MDGVDENGNPLPADMSLTSLCVIGLSQASQYIEVGALNT